MTLLSNSLHLPKISPPQLSSGSHFKSVDVCTGNGCLINSTFKTSRQTRRNSLAVQASYSDGGRPSSGSIFISGFVLGGIVVGTLGAVYAPQISKALAGADKKDLMRKLPKFIYDEEKALERTRKILSEKIEQLNSAIDDVSAQLRTEDSPNGVAVDTDEIEAAM
ncbi:Localized to the inner membrane of the chloroplast [Heracleum sosnowskyi]|uniref:Localized to the inner membrane of the chloroplast n=1 Tax=Heracleum sosnowskyi TaxID=360622 RepID=A0AAD8N1U3_9APIA|nr:Localized to the inner membrane of the chloroplast [Heracleum sosnowskyi]